MLKERFTKPEISFAAEGILSEIRVTGHSILVKPYVRPTTVGDLEVPESARFEDQHHSLICEVLDIGPTAYTDEKYCGGAAFCEIGDWVVITRVAGVRIALDGDSMLRIVNEDEIKAIVKNPEKWEIRVKHTKF